MFTWMTFRPVYKTLSITMAKFRRTRNDAAIQLFQGYKDKVDGIKDLVKEDEAGQAQRALRGLIEELNSSSPNPDLTVEYGGKLLVYEHNLSLLKDSLVELQGKIS